LGWHPHLALAGPCLWLHMFDHEIDSTPLEHIPPGKPHDLTDLFPIPGLVTVVGAVLALRLGIHGTFGPHDRAVEDELGALGTELHIEFFGILGERAFGGEGRPFGRSVFLAAVDLGQVRQDTYILADLLGFFLVQNLL